MDGEDAVCTFAVTEVESRLLSLLRALSAADVKKADCFGRCQALELSSAVSDEAQSGGKLFRKVQALAELVRDLLQTDDPQALASAVEKIEDDIGTGDESGLMNFLSKHKTGIALVEDAKTRAASRQTEVQSELKVGNLTSSLADLREKFPVVDAQALDGYAGWWKERASGQAEEAMVPTHRLKLQLLTKQFWSLLEEGGKTFLSASLSTCVDCSVQFLRGQLKQMDQNGPGQANRQDNIHFDVAEVKNKMFCNAFVDHGLWKTEEKHVPAKIRQLLADYKRVSQQTGQLLDYVLSKHKIGVVRVPEPSSDKLKTWQDLNAHEFLEPDVAENFDSDLKSVVIEELEGQALRAFAAVGTLVEGCVAHTSGLEGMGGALSEVANYQVEAMLKLPKEGPWAGLLPLFFEAPCVSCV